MKLVLCPICGDIFKLHFRKRFCYCGHVWGYYADFFDAVISKNAIPIGFTNTSLNAALNKQPKSGDGVRFEAFVIPKECPTITVREDRS